MSAYWPQRLARPPADLLRAQWDLLVIGGGITGAGIVREAARRGLRALLVEQRDFAWGTSSRSSKLVHGGLRYLKQGQLGLTRESVRERERLLPRRPAWLIRWLPSPTTAATSAAPPSARPGALRLMAGRRERALATCAGIRPAGAARRADGLRAASCYMDANTDDARLVLRVLRRRAPRRRGAQLRGGAGSLLHERDQVVRRAACRTASARRAARGARAAGDQRHRRLGRSAARAAGAAPRLRPLRGSHLVFPAWRLPVAQVSA